MRSRAYPGNPAGNRTQAGAQTFVFDDQNRLTSGGGTTYSWSLRGRLLSSTTGSTTTNSTHDVFGLELTNGTVGYTYDGLGRIAKRNGTQTFGYSGTGMDPILDGTWASSTDPGGQPLATRTGTTSSWGLMDRHGDLIGLINAGVTSVVGSQSFDPFGVLTQRTGGLTPTMGFQADWTDPTSSQVWMGARFYKPAPAMFTSRDTYDGVLSSPLSLNRYTYAEGD